MFPIYLQHNIPMIPTKSSESSFVSILENIFLIFQEEEEEDDIPFCLVDIRGDVIRARKLQSRDNDDSHSILHSSLLLWSSLSSQHYEHQSTLQTTHLAVIKVLETLDPTADGEYTKNTRTRHILDCVWLGTRFTWLLRILAPTHSHGSELDGSSSRWTHTSIKKVPCDNGGVWVCDIRILVQAQRIHVILIQHSYQYLILHRYF